MPKEFINDHYYLVSFLLILAAFGIFFFCYEKKKPQARELVVLAVMSGIAVASRAAFVMIPFFKPMSGIIMITAMAFGPGAGFLVGAISAFVSNFIFGQGPWTPWQMLAYAIAGMLAGVLGKRNIMAEEKPFRTAVIGYGIVQLILGPILDTSSIFTMRQSLSGAYAKAIYISGIIPNLIHGTATFLTLLILTKPMLEKLNRMKKKYQMLEEGQDADFWEAEDPGK